MREETFAQSTPTKISTSWHAEDVMQGLTQPVLSLYLPTTLAGRFDSTEMRASKALSHLGAPRKISRQVLEHLRNESHRRTTAIFADANGCKSIELDTELPITDLASGEVHAGWGEPILGPLLLLASQPHAAVVFVDRLHVRLFEIRAGSINERDSWHRNTMEEVFGGDAVVQASKQVHPAYIAARSGAVRDKVDAHDNILTHRFHREIGKILIRVLPPAVDCLIIMGPEQERHAFCRELPASIRRYVEAKLPSMDSPTASPANVLARCSGALKAINIRRQEMRISEILSSELHTTGAQHSSPANERRISHLVAAWQLPQDTREELVKSARQQSATLTFVDGELGQRLLDDHDGWVAELRW